MLIRNHKAEKEKGRRKGHGTCCNLIQSTMANPKNGGAQDLAKGPWTKLTKSITTRNQ